MCYRKSDCPFYSPNGNNSLCSRCTHIAKFRRTARLSQIGLIIAIVVFITVTCLIYS